MGLTIATQQNLLDKEFGGTDYTPATSLYVGLSSTAPAADGTNVTEPSTGGYARVEVVNNDTNWNSATSADPTVKDNASTITFPESTAAWLTSASLTHFVIYDAATNGELRASGALDTARTVDAAGITLSFAAGELNIQLDKQ